MRLLRFTACLALILFCLAIPNSAQSNKSTKSDKLTVQGKLTRIMAIGGESSGWAIELNPALTVEGKEVSSIEIVYVDSSRLEALANKTVKATGTLSNVTGVETGQRPVLNLSSIKAIKQKPTKDDSPKSNY